MAFIFWKWILTMHLPKKIYIIIYIYMYVFISMVLSYSGLIYSFSQSLRHVHFFFHLTIKTTIVVPCSYVLYHIETAVFFKYITVLYSSLVYLKKYNLSYLDNILINISQSWNLTVKMFFLNDKQFCHLLLSQYHGTTFRWHGTRFLGGWVFML